MVAGSSGDAERVYYRIVKTNPPTLADFMSNAAQGRRLEHPTPARQRLWDGISAWRTVAQARRSARRYPRSGRWIATLRIPDDGAIEVEKTLGPGHHTLWGEPATMARCVIAVVLAR